MMICQRIICFVAIAFITTATCNAQHVTNGDGCQTCVSGDCHTHAGYSGCGGVGCAIFKCQGHAYFPEGNSCCPKPWTYDQASALWGTYCYQRGCGRGCGSGCLSGYNGPRGNAGLCHPAGSAYGGACSTGTCCGTCGSSLQTGCSLNCSSHVGHQGIFNNMFRRHGNVQCDSACDNGVLQPQQACLGTRHGMNLFSVLKSRCNPPCNPCSSGCDAVADPNCGYDEHGIAAQPNQMNTQVIKRVKTSYPQ